MNNHLDYLFEKIAKEDKSDPLYSALKKDQKKSSSQNKIKKVNDAVLDGDSSDLAPIKGDSSRKSKEAYIRSKIGLNKTEPDAVDSVGLEDGDTGKAELRGRRKRIASGVNEEEGDEEEEEESQRFSIDENIAFKWVIRDGKKVKKYFLSNPNLRKNFRIEYQDDDQKKPRVVRMKPSEKRNRKVAQRIARKRGGRAKGNKNNLVRKKRRSELKGLQNGIYRDRDKLKARTLRQALVPKKK
jgi:hypothetical protein